MERMIIKLSMFHTLALGVLSIWFGDWLRAKFPFLKKYCLAQLSAVRFLLSSAYCFTMPVSVNCNSITKWPTACSTASSLQPAVLLPA